METLNIIYRNPSALLMMPLVWFLFIGLAWRRRFKPFGPFLLRLFIIVLVLLALTDPIRLPPEQSASHPPIERDRLVLLVDQSASLGEGGQKALRDEAARISQAYEEVFTFYFADEARLINHPTDSPPLNPTISDIGAALHRGAAMLQNSGTGRLMLLSDGYPTEPNFWQQVAPLAVPVDVVAVDEATLKTWRGGENEIRLTRLAVPSVLREGESFEVEITVHSEQSSTITLNLYQNRETLAQAVEVLEPGYNSFNIETSVSAVGPQSFEAIIAPEPQADVWPENNRLAAYAQVYPPPKILMVGDDLTHVANYATLLRNAGYQPDVMLPESVPTTLSRLEPYDGLVLLDVSARSFTLEQMVNIQEFVRSLGRGLLVTGGRNSLSLGNYAETPLERLIPTNLEPPPREERPPVALLLMLDHSGSMVENRQIFTKLAMAKEAAIRATDILGPDDLIGMLMFDNNFEWVIPFQAVNDGAALLDIQQRIATIPAGGGTRILQALQIGLPALAEQPVPSGARHAVLLTDGRSFDGLEAEAEYQQLLAEMSAANITLSTIAIGMGADQELLSYLAQEGKGRYHFAAEPSELPALTISESDILRTNSVQESDSNAPFEASVYQSHPMIRGLFNEEENTPPPLSGYLALTAKPLAEIALQIGPGDPLLTVWGYGLGRVAVWSSDTGQEWAVDWPNWPEASKFWGQVVGYTLPAPDLGLLQLSTDIGRDGAVTLMANGVYPNGQTVELAPTIATLTTPGGQATEVRLHQIGPGQYQQTVKLADAGVYQYSVTQSRNEDEEEQEIAAQTGFVVPYAPEYALPSAGMGARLLREVAQLTGGTSYSLGQAHQPEPSPPTTAEPSPPAEPLAMWPYLLGLALLLWPAEIAWRRWSGLRIQ